MFFFLSASPSSSFSFNCMANIHFSLLIWFVQVYTNWKTVKLMACHEIRKFRFEWNVEWESLVWCAHSTIGWIFWNSMYFQMLVHGLSHNVFLSHRNWQNQKKQQKLRLQPKHIYGKINWQFVSKEWMNLKISPGTPSADHIGISLWISRHRTFCICSGGLRRDWETERRKRERQRER